MKIIHTGDLHLDSPLNSNFDYDKALLRKDEVLSSFLRLVDYAEKTQVKAVIIAGDLFESEKVSIKTEQVIIDKIKSVENIDFLYLKGNHDENAKFQSELPKNFKIFSDGFSTFDYDDVTIGGITPESKDFSFEKGRFNIAVMHGSIAGGDYAIDLNLFKNKNINYLALGHIHKPSIEKVDKNFTYAYCGCLEGRGFDECGKKGFVLVDTDEKSYEFVEFASRENFDLQVDVSSATSTLDIKDLIREATENIDENSIVRVTLTGKISKSLVINELSLKESFADNFFLFCVKNNTSVLIDYNEYKNDVSLKGEMVRVIEVLDLPERIKEKILTVAFNALDFEELGL